MNRRLYNDLEQRILVLDGALGTMIQSYHLTESDFRGEKFANWSTELLGCNDILVLTSPSTLKEIYASYLKAGADIITTNSFNSNTISMEEYGLEDYIYDLNYQAATIARESIVEGGYAGRYVAGSVGPTGRSASMSPIVEDAAYRNITFDQLFAAYTTQITALIDGGVDLILLETIFDTLNAKAAIKAHDAVCDTLNRSIPLMISGTITDNSGRTLSGQTVEAFAYSLPKSKHIITVGLNCAFGAELIYPYLKRLEQISSHYISVHPNAGLPDAFGCYSHTPDMMGEIIEGFMSEGLINIVGGCCGTTPEHIALIAELAKKHKPRKLRAKDNTSTYCGLEPLRLTKEVGFINIGERANVAGSAKFARLMRDKNYDEALRVVAMQVESGAAIIDICMDDAMIDGVEAMSHFLNLIASEPDIARLPIMIDSSKWEVLEAGLKCAQGRCIVNSISLKEGEQQFIDHALSIKSYGGAAVVMLFDENGQADSYERKIEVATRAYNLLVGCGFEADDIIFDPNVLTIGTGLKEHDNYAIDFIRATKYIKDNLPHAKVSGGISNLSFAFRGNNPVREAMHSAFLYHTIDAGLDMAIVNASNMIIYEDIESTLLQKVEDLIFNRHNHATEQLVDYAIKLKESAAANDNTTKTNHLEWRDSSVEDRIAYSIVRGVLDYIDEDIQTALSLYPTAVDIIEGPLMSGMKQVGELFGSGKMFLPQVIKSARVMKRAVEILSPFIEQGTTTSVGKIVVATVKGDVHDIGKNIVSIVLACNGFEVIDLGVMTPPDKIIEAIRLHSPKVLALSGLITPSLDEMASLLELLNRENIDIPVLVGGATTSQLHTAVKLAPIYNGLVEQTTDASSAAKCVVELTGSNCNNIIAQIKDKQRSIREKYYIESSQNRELPIELARQKGFKANFKKKVKPKKVGYFDFENLPFGRIFDLINWTSFYAAWHIKWKINNMLMDKTKRDEALRLYTDACRIMAAIRDETIIKAAISILKATSSNETITVKGGLKIDCPRSLSKESKINYSLADFIDRKNDYVAFINVSIMNCDELLSKHATDDYKKIMLKILFDRMTESAAEYLHYLVRTEYFGYSDELFRKNDILKGRYQGIRPAFGYPSLPDHSLKRAVFDHLDIENRVGTKLTENYSMIPAASISAMVFAHPDSRYFLVK